MIVNQPTSQHCVLYRQMYSYKMHFNLEYQGTLKHATDYKDQNILRCCTKQSDRN
jgi:hypothetical protein